jgi:hypothetical protein
MTDNIELISLNFCLNSFTVLQYSVFRCSFWFHIYGHLWAWRFDGRGHCRNICFSINRSCVSFRILVIVSSELSEAFKFWMDGCIIVIVLIQCCILVFAWSECSSYLTVFTVVDISVIMSYPSVMIMTILITCIWHEHNCNYHFNIYVISHWKQTNTKSKFKDYIFGQNYQEQNSRNTIPK